MKKLTIEEFIEKARLVHRDKYDYSKVNYINNLTKIVIICLLHGEFEQTPGNHYTITDKEIKILLISNILGI